MRSISENITRVLFPVAFCTLALFIPFSISGANTGILLAFLATVVAALGQPSARERYREMMRDPLFSASILLVLSALPSVFMSENMGRALRDWKSYWLLLVYFVTAYNVTSPRLRKVAFWVLFGSMNLSCVVALVQYRGGADLGFLRIAPETYRPGSTLYNMTFAGILYQVITLNFALAFAARLSLRNRLMLGTAVMLGTFTLLITLTRGAWLALIGGLGTVPVVLRRRGVILAGCILLGVAAIVVATTPTLRNRAATVTRSLGESADKNVATRLVLWDISLEVFREAPLFGVGMGDYSIEAERHLRERRVTTTVDSHNVYLQILATRGIFGFIPFVIFWMVLVRTLWRTRRRFAPDGMERHFLAGALAATVAVLIGALSENNVDDSEVLIAFMFITGLARSFRWEKSNEPGGRPLDRS